MLTLLFVAAALLGFVAIADEVLEGETLGVERGVLRWLASVRVGWLDEVALQITALGNLATLIVVVLAAGAVLWGARRKISFALLTISLVTGWLAMRALKVAFGRPRPDLSSALAEELSGSFPSGHAMGAAATYGTVAFLVGRMARGGLRWATWAGAAVLVVLIGLSRMYVGVHYPSDVIAGWLGGVVWISLLVLLFHVLGMFARELPDLDRAEPELDDHARDE